MTRSSNCRWIYRPGTNNSHWAYTACKKGFNPLTRIPASEPFIGCADFYNNKLCPICDRPICIDYVVIKENKE